MVKGKKGEIAEGCEAKEKALSNTFHFLLCEIREGSDFHDGSFPATRREYSEPSLSPQKRAF